MVYVLQQDDAGIYRDWTLPPDPIYHPTTRLDRVMNVRMHQMMAQAYARARESQAQYGMDDSDSLYPEDESHPLRFNEVQQEVEQYLVYINALPPRPKRRVRSQSEPTVPTMIDEALVPDALPAVPPRPRWRRFLSLDISKAPPRISPVKLWKRTQSLPATLSFLQLPMLPVPTVSLSRRAPFARFSRTKSTSDASASSVEEDGRLKRVESAPQTPLLAPVEEEKPPVKKRARRMTVDDGQTVIARSRLQKATPPPATPILVPMVTPTRPVPPTPKKNRCHSTQGSRTSVDNSQIKIKFPVKPVPLRLELIIPKRDPNAPTTPPGMPTSPLETTATCPYSIRQRPLPSDADMGYGIPKALPEEGPEEKPLTKWDFVYVLLFPIVCAFVTMIVAALVVLPMYILSLPVGLARRWISSVGAKVQRLCAHEYADETDEDEDEEFFDCF